MSIVDTVTGLLPTGWLLPLAGIGLAVTGAALGVQTWRLHTAQTDLARETAAWATQMADLQRTAREATEEYREKEQLLNAANERIRHDRDEDQRRNDAVVTAMRAGDDQLRDAIAHYAAGSGGATSDSVAACQQRAATLGHLLEDGLRLQVDLAGAAEDRLADARHLQEWADEVKSSHAAAPAASSP